MKKEQLETDIKEIKEVLSVYKSARENLPSDIIDIHEYLTTLNLNRGICYYVKLSEYNINWMDTTASYICNPPFVCKVAEEVQLSLDLRIKYLENILKEKEKQLSISIPIDDIREHLSYVFEDMIHTRYNIKTMLHNKIVKSLVSKFESNILFPKLSTNHKSNNGDYYFVVQIFLENKVILSYTIYFIYDNNNYYYITDIIEDAML